MQYILSPAEMRALDADMIERQGLLGVVLMEHAAMGVTNVAAKLFGRSAEFSNGAERMVLILCGLGNNGGDGLAVLRQLAMRGIPAVAALLGQPGALSGDAHLQYEMACGAGLRVVSVQDESALNALPWESVAVIVDALFGTGLSRALSGLPLLAVRHMNRAQAKVVSVDIPSGVDGGTGRVLGEAVQAAVTVTFQHKKLGHLLLPGRAHAGELLVVPIGLAQPAQPAVEEWEEADVRVLLPARPPESHKGKNGRALLLAGSEKYAGAALLSANAALRTGAGLLYAAVPAGIHTMFFACPAAISQPVGKTGEWDAVAAEQAGILLEGKDAVAIGPGMGAGGGVPLLLQRVLERRLPAIIDADGLNALAGEVRLRELLHRDAVLTPHPGEMARLTGLPQAEILEDPMGIAKEYAAKWGCTLLLKGATSVISDGSRVCLNTTGNPGLAKGGSGDVLTGILLGLLAQGVRGYTAVCAGAYLLGAAADEAVRLLGNRMLLPTDTIAALMNYS